MPFCIVTGTTEKTSTLKKSAWCTCFSLSRFYPPTHTETFLPRAGTASKEKWMNKGFFKMMHQIFKTIAAFCMNARQIKWIFRSLFPLSLSLRLSMFALELARYRGVYQSMEKKHKKFRPSWCFLDVSTTLLYAWLMAIWLNA